MGDFFSDYQGGDFFDEMFAGPGAVRPHYSKLFARFKEMEREEVERKRALAASTLLTQGVTFTVYNDDQGTERIFPFDLVPRIIPADEWELVERGLVQRITALNLFLHDIYHTQNILRDRVIPQEIVWEAAHFRPEFMYFDVPRNIYIHICGTDLVRDKEGAYLVLEDNARCPSGVSYVHREPANDEAHVPGFARAISRPTVDGLQPGIAQRAAPYRPGRKKPNRSWSFSRQAFTTRPTSSTHFSPARWVSRSSKDATSWRKRAGFSCARPWGSSQWT